MLAIKQCALSTCTRFFIEPNPIAAMYANKQSPETGRLEKAENMR